MSWISLYQLIEIQISDQKNCCCRGGFDSELEMDLGQLYCLRLHQQVDVFV